MKGTSDKSPKYQTRSHVVASLQIGVEFIILQHGQHGTKMVNVLLARAKDENIVKIDHHKLSQERFQYLRHQYNEGAWSVEKSK